MQLKGTTDNSPRPIAGTGTRAHEFDILLAIEALAREQTAPRSLPTELLKLVSAGTKEAWEVPACSIKEVVCLQINQKETNLIRHK